MILVGTLILKILSKSMCYMG